jgi:hypothetical protein
MLIMHAALVATVMPYLLFVVTTPDWIGRYALFLGTSAGHEIVGESSGLWSWVTHRIGVEASRWMGILVPPFRLHYLAVPVFCGLAIARGPASGRAVALFAAVTYAALALVASKHWRYLAPLVPLAYVAAATMIPQHVTKVRKTPIPAFLFIAAIGFCYDVLIIVKHRHQNVSQELAKLGELPDRYSTVVGEQRFWFAYRKRRYVPWDNDMAVLRATKPNYVWLRREQWTALQEPSESGHGPLQSEKERAIRHWLSTDLGLSRFEEHQSLFVSGREYVGIVVRDPLNAQLSDDNDVRH